MARRLPLIDRLLRTLSADRAQPARTRMQVETMEERILHSADPAAGVFGAGAPGGAVAAPQIEQRLLDDAGEFSSPDIQAQDHASLEVVFIDQATPDYASILDDIAAQAGSRPLQVVVLDASRDGITQIGEYLAGRQDVAAVHLISHGSDGSIQLGNASLDAELLAGREAEIAGWSAALTHEADILIYGCNVAASADGRALVTALANVIGADVAASDDLTGSAAQGGDWDLEYAVGRIDARMAVTAQIQTAWTGVLANTSPTLAGAQDLGSITEDPATNPGTRVSDLIAGQVTDPDGGALGGIAVVAVDDSNGTWQYSTDGGGSWNAFGTPSATSARLLGADANTYVRFVPNADWNGTVANGLTFRAWDQTSGTAGGTADTTTTSSTVLDQFTSVSYSNNDGTAAWSTNWIDDDGDPSGGAVSISGGRMQLQTLLGGGAIYRQADLTGATSATLTFNYDNQILLSLGGSIALRVSDDGGGSYTTLATFSSSSTTGSGTFSADITGFVAGNTRIQFVSSGLSVVQSLFIDDVQISYVTPLASGVTAFSTATASSGITVTPVNDAPDGTDQTIAITEDTPYVLSAADFGYADTRDVPANNFIAVTIASLPGAGTLTLNGVAVTAGQSIAIGDILAGDLVFTPAADAAGTGIANFTFQVQDDGGGADLDPTPNTLSFDAANVQDPPSGADNTVAVNENAIYTFGPADFGFSDADGDSFVAVTIASLPSAGLLTLNGSAVSVGQSISIGLLTAGRLEFTPAPGANGTGYAAFGFQVESSGGVSNLDPVARTMTIDVASINDPPVGTANTVTTSEDAAYAFTVADFGFTDPGDTPANALLAVRIASLPGAGSLTLNGIAVTAGQFVSATDIAAGLLLFTPAADASGTGYAAFTFQVQDDGGGADLDIAARTMGIDVTAVNDAPVLTNNNGVTVGEGSSVAIDAGMLHVSDTESAPAQLVYSIGLSPAHGFLALSTSPGVAISSFSQDDIASNRLVYVHDGSEAASDSFSFTVSDGTGGSIGATTFAITVSPVNDAPVATMPGAQTLLAGLPLVFSAANGNGISIADADAGGATVQVTLSVAHGALTLAGTAGLAFVTGGGSGDSTMTFTGSAADINAALDGLQLTAAPGFLGTIALSIAVDDLGNAGAGGPLGTSASVAVSMAVSAAPGPVPTAPVIIDPPALPELPATPAPAPEPAAETPAAGEEAAADDPAESPAGGGLVADAAPDAIFELSSRPFIADPDRRDGASGGRGGNVAFGAPDMRLLLASADTPEITVADFSLGQASVNFQAAQSALQSQALLDGMDRLREDLQDEAGVEFNTVALTTAASLGLSVGYVLWLLRGGVLVSSMLSSMPAWRFVDPLPILGRLADEDEMEEPDETLESMVERNNRIRGATGAAAA